MNLFYRLGLVLLVASLPAHGAGTNGTQNGSHLDTSIEIAIAGRVGVSDSVAAYMTMLNSNDAGQQRIASREIFASKLREPELLALLVEKIEGKFMRSGLYSREQDAVAWMCKALGQAGKVEHARFLAIVANSTPYTRIKKHARVYALPGVDTFVTDDSVSVGAVTAQEPAELKIEGLYASEVTSTSHYYFDKRSHRSLNYQFMQDGDTVVGVNDQIRLKVIGKLEGSTITFYTLPSRMGPSELKGKWKVSSDGRELRGTWSIGGGGGKWNLTRIE